MANAKKPALYATLFKQTADGKMTFSAKKDAEKVHASVFVGSNQAGIEGTGIDAVVTTRDGELKVKKLNLKIDGKWYNNVTLFPSKEGAKTDFNGHTQTKKGDSYVDAHVILGYIVRDEAGAVKKDKNGNPMVTLMIFPAEESPLAPAAAKAPAKAPAAFDDDIPF